jgi:hypothetical protein
VTPHSGATMPIRRYLDGQAFEPEMISTMSEVLERVCAKLGLAYGRPGALPSRTVPQRPALLFSALASAARDAAGAA